MNPMIKNLTLAAALFTMTVTLATVGPNSTALAQTAAPAVNEPLHRVDDSPVPAADTFVRPRAGFVMLYVPAAR